MEYEQVIKGRRSARGYKQESVAKEVLEEVISLATQAPSSMNTQPWHFHVVTGEALDKIREENTKRNIEGVPPFKRNSFSSWLRRSSQRKTNRSCYSTV